MKGWLLDTNVISHLAPARASSDPFGPALAEWIRRRSDRLFLSTMTVAEIQAGICKLRRAGGSPRADAFAMWLDAILRSFGDRVLPLDVETALLAGEFVDRVRSAGKDPGLADTLIAASAERHELSLLTLNKKHFEQFALRHPVLDPKADLPERRG